MSKQISKEEFEALRPSSTDRVVTERDGEFAYETITGQDGEEIAFATYRDGKCVGYTLVEG